MADRRLGVELLLLLEREGEEGAGGIEEGSLERRRDAMADDLEEASGPAGGANLIDDLVGGRGGSIGEIRLDIDGRDVDGGPREFRGDGSHRPLDLVVVEVVVVVDDRELQCSLSQRTKDREDRGTRGGHRNSHDHGNI